MQATTWKAFNAARDARAENATYEYNERTRARLQAARSRAARSKLPGAQSR